LSTWTPRSLADVGVLRAAYLRRPVLPERPGIPVASAARWTVARRLLAFALAVLGIVVGAAVAAAATGGRLKIDFAGQAYNVMPPGEDGSVPPDANSTSQISLYDGLAPLRGHVTTGDLGIYFKSERFGVQGPVVRSENTGRAGLTILRDRFDVPHVYGRTRDEVMFGAGWVAVEDRGLLGASGIGVVRVSAGLRS
jgi:hypothetical protein